MVHSASGGNTLGMECLKARNLLAAYAVAALEHIDAANALTDVEELASNGKEKHNAEHQCLDEQFH
jgi:hypothetical protein